MGIRERRSAPGLGLGAFLVGLGSGWLIFGSVRVTSNLFAWTLIFGGAMISLSSLFSYFNRFSAVRGVTGGLVVGLIISMIATAPFNFAVSTSGSYRATDTKTFTGPVLAKGIYLEVDNFNGPIQVSTWARDEYSIELDIRAKGETQSEAERHMEELDIEFRDTDDQGKKRLTLGYDIPPMAHSLYSITVRAYLPGEAVIELDLGSNNGGISLEDLGGGVIYLSTSNGALSFENVRVERVRASSSNGGIFGDLSAKYADFSTSNGRIELSLSSTVSGEYHLGTRNGWIELDLSSSAQVGYDIDLSTSNGGIDIDLPNLDYRIDQNTRKRVVTEGFSGKLIQITIHASTSNAGIDVGT
ncbi:MAG: DUF4097 family beta strand repeat protein [Candidatus Bathyarchaeota archaeon]|nr:MAG: DUF4097 family beta strand repeat protein [Candidatus Bathyarchaeota archaeon]